MQLFHVPSRACFVFSGRAVESFLEASSTAQRERLTLLHDMTKQPVHLIEQGVSLLDLDGNVGIAPLAPNVPQNKKKQ
eukprot:4720414-Amphidinium_carterae.1